MKVPRYRFLASAFTKMEPDIRLARKLWKEADTTEAVRAAQLVEEGIRVRLALAFHRDTESVNSVSHCMVPSLEQYLDLASQEDDICPRCREKYPPGVTTHTCKRKEKNQ